MNVDIRQIRYFVTVAETLHFGRAAERLHLTQPPLSRQVAALEAALGVRLLERHSRHVRLTAAGRQLLTDGKAVLATFDRACRNAQLADAGRLGDLTIGFMVHAAYSSVPALTRRFIAAYPDVRLNLRETMPFDIVDGLQEGAIDAGVTFDPGAVRGLEKMVIHREQLCVVLNQDHHLAAKALIKVEDLAGEALIVTPSRTAPALRQAVDNCFAHAGLEPVVRMETQLQQTIVSLVAEGLGMALVPQSLRRLGVGGVVYRYLADAPWVEQVLAWRSDALNPALAPLLEVARSG